MPSSPVAASDGAAPLLLVDEATAASDRILPPAWLQGLRVATYPSGRLLAAEPAARAEAAAVLVRSMTRLGPDELAALPSLGAVATLSSGEDHLDAAALAARGLHAASGRGGNARAVADWVQWALGCAFPDGLPADARVAVVGVGAVGGAVAADLEARGAQVLRVDPPRAVREGGAGFVTLDAAIAARPHALTLHVPRVRSGPHATVGLLDAARLGRLEGAALLDAARGELIDESAAAALRRSGRLRFLALDVFAGEPRPDPDVVDAADLVTAHIAGHTVEGKLRVALFAVLGLWQQLERLRPDLRRPDCLRDPDRALRDAVDAALNRAGSPPPTSLRASPALAAADRDLRACTALGRDFLAVRAAHLRVESSAGVDRPRPHI